MGLIVQKFGGTCLADPTRILEVAAYVARIRRQGHSIVLVASAMGDETDGLLRLAGQVSHDPPRRELDVLVTGGESKACALIAMALDRIGVPAVSLTGGQVGLLTDAGHTNAKILGIGAERIRAALSAGHVPVVGGSQGISPDGDTTFLGRGSSDTSAVALASALDADACELYTDVAGVFTADPRVVLDARRLGWISFDEMLEMAASGCPKPAMRAVEFARTHHVPLHVRAAFSWKPGTWVGGDGPGHPGVVTAIAHDLPKAKITVLGMHGHGRSPALLLRALADAEVGFDTLVQNGADAGTASLTFTVPTAGLQRALLVCERVAAEAGARVAPQPAGEFGRVSLVGAGMKGNTGVAAAMFEVLARAGTNIEMISTSPIRVSCLVDAAVVEDAVRALHREFALDSSGPASGLRPVEEPAVRGATHQATFNA